MATHKSAIKRHRQSIKRRDRNRNHRSEVRTAFKKARSLVESGDTSGALSALREAESLIAKASSKGIYKKKTAARHISRLAKKVSAKK